MTVYVDGFRLDATVGRWHARWSHLQADSVEELHAFAAQIGLRREWFQPGSRPEAAHYDVTDGKRRMAVALGAVLETVEDGSARRRDAAKRRATSPSQPISGSRLATRDTRHESSGPPS